MKSASKYSEHKKKREEIDKKIAQTETNIAVYRQEQLSAREGQERARQKIAQADQKIAQADQTLAGINSQVGEMISKFVLFLEGNLNTLPGQQGGEELLPLVEKVLADVKVLQSRNVNGENVIPELKAMQGIIMDLGRKISQLSAQ